MEGYINIRARKKSIIIIIGIAVLVSMFSIYGILYILTPYLGFARSIVWGDSDIKDYQRFPFRIIHNAQPVFQFSTIQDIIRDTDKKTSSNNNNNNNAYAPFLSQSLLDDIISSNMNTSDNAKAERTSFDNFLASTGTTAFIVIKDDKVLYEKYFNGYQRDSINTSFSMAKSITSALIAYFWSLMYLLTVLWIPLRMSESDATSKDKLEEIQIATPDYQ